LGIDDRREVFWCIVHRKGGGRMALSMALNKILDEDKPKYISRYMERTPCCKAKAGRMWASNLKDVSFLILLAANVK
jgi:hypothetical protein